MRNYGIQLFHGTVKYRINKCCEEEENMKKFKQLLEPRILGTTGPIPFKFDT